MRILSRRVAITSSIAALALVVTCVGAIATSHHFAYHKVRSGLPAGLPQLSVTSTDLVAHRPMPQELWGCTDPGSSPQLSWSGAPASTQS